ncbi:hypothetical protein TraAM80_04599 [Trypanosoma rangeli]|uniref:Uncharacterized protein n=1 Tax=Trypanosoma rangeli TaxID=5698 RepID=A0A3R7L0U3_TRYRA|nr:uncharacterized protein TraAM80_04599 [Trypanosoma rangeli]RNF05308.1 hypothetical protein TraAM80_04599 [Trypanosoma rangeli]|eukprot:RNF05308.1 hypothetical protein TraAM80_04599 [Trypanosoma rangeli]
MICSPSMSRPPPRVAITGRCRRGKCSSSRTILHLCKAALEATGRSPHRSSLTTVAHFEGRHRFKGPEAFSKPPPLLESMGGVASFEHLGLALSGCRGLQRLTL